MPKSNGQKPRKCDLSRERAQQPTPRMFPLSLLVQGDVGNNPGVSISCSSCPCSSIGRFSSLFRWEFGTIVALENI
uniref:Uncharacterized protein n=1 Tax=Solanum tuberosum TaxID=4113 RepID=M1AZY2_SOLTU